MKSDSDNRRVQYTRIFLKEALLDLLSKKNMNKITVSELCDRANVNRGTFYSHYNDIGELYTDIEAEISQIIIKKLNLNHQLDMTMIIDALDYIKDNITICKILDSNGGENKFYTMCTAAIKDNVISLWKTLTDKDIPDDEYDFIYVYIVGGALDVIHHWAVTKFQKSSAEIAKLIMQLSYNGLKVLGGKLAGGL